MLFRSRAAVKSTSLHWRRSRGPIAQPLRSAARSFRKPRRLDKAPAALRCAGIANGNRTAILGEVKDWQSGAGLRRRRFYANRSTALMSPDSSRCLGGGEITTCDSLDYPPRRHQRGVAGGGKGPGPPRSFLVRRKPSRSNNRFHSVNILETGWTREKYEI